MTQRYPRAADLAQMHHCSACGMTDPITEDGYTTCCNKRECTGMSADSQDACCSAVQERLEHEAAQGEPPAPALHRTPPAAPKAKARRRRAAARPKADPSPQTDETQGLHSVKDDANLVSHGGPGKAPTPPDTKEPTMAANIDLIPVIRAKDGSPVLPAGTNVTPLKGVTGKTVGEPALTATGYVVTVQYDEEFAHLAPSGGADFAVEELKVIVRTEPAAAPAPARKGRREALGAASAEGWELLYDKPKQGCEVGRRYVGDKPEYALICKEHKHVHALPRLTTERSVRTAGGWCPSCK